MSMNMDYYRNGLTSDEVYERRSSGLTNEVTDNSAKSVKDIVRENVFTYFNGIFLLLAILLVMAGAYTSLTFLPVIIFNTLIGIVQEINAKNVLDKLNVISQLQSTVLRDGRQGRIDVTKLVRDDIIRLKSGNQIPADAVVVDGRISVNEALLTGESDEVEKTPEEGQNELRSGSFVVAGDCFARLTRVGNESYVAKLTARAKQMQSGEQSEMIRSINRLIMIAGILIIPVGITLFCQSYFTQMNSFSTSVVSMVAAVIGMIPEGLYLLVSVALALSTIRLAQNHVVLHDMKSIETLARVDVLCVDKTGTITDNEMYITDCVLPAAAENSVELENYSRILGAYLEALSDDNITMTALREKFRVSANLNVVSSQPFSSRNKYSEVATNDMVYRLGAPEFILNETSLANNREILDRYTRRGERVLVFAGKSNGDSFEPFMFIAMKNGIRPNVEKTFAYFKRQGVRIKVISGDNPVTVSKIAASVGIAGSDKYIDCSQIESDAMLSGAVREYTVFGRVSPEQKKKIILALKNQGRTVAMTGDGVNDILAMKEADCSIAMGSGSDAAMQASQVVLLDSDFTHMQNIVYEGRRNINNISRSATLFLVKNIFSLLLSIFSIINVIEYPLQPTQISLISAFNIGIPAFFLAFEPNQERQKPHFLRRVLLRAMPAALTDFFIIAAMVLFAQVFEVPKEDVSVASTFLLAIVGFIILISITHPMNRYRLTIIVGCIIGLMITAYFFNDLFAISYISTKCILLFVLFAIATEPCMRYMTKLLRYCEQKIPDETREKAAGKRIGRRK